MTTSTLPNVPQTVGAQGGAGLWLKLGRLGRAAGETIAARMGRSRMSQAERREVWVQSLLLRIERALADIERGSTNSDPAQRARQENLRALLQLHQQLSGLSERDAKSAASSAGGDVLQRASALQMWLDEEERCHWEVSVLPAQDATPPSFDDTRPAEESASTGATLTEAESHRRLHLDLMLIMQAEKRRHRRRRSRAGASRRSAPRQTIGEPGPLVTSMIELLMLGWLALRGDLRAAARYARSLAAPVPVASLQVRLALQRFLDRCDAATNDLLELPALPVGDARADVDRASRAQLLADVASLRQQVQGMLDALPVHGSTIKKVLPSGTAVRIRRGHLMLNVVDDVVTAAWAQHLRDLDRAARAAATERASAGQGSREPRATHDPMIYGWSLGAADNRSYY